MLGAWLVRLLVLGKAASPGVPNRKLFLPAGLFFLLILFQLTPLPPRVVRVLSPETAALYSTFLADLAPQAETAGSTTPAEGGNEEAPGATRNAESPSPLTAEPAADPFTTARALSLARDRTQREGLLFLSYVALLYLFINYKPEGSTRRFVQRTVVCVAVAGILTALTAILQKVLGATRIYGFWQPLHESTVGFMGPYINANHFAGYMELVLPTILALFFAWAAAMKRSARESAHYLDTLQSPENNKIALGLLGIGVMVLALFLSFSRAGIASFLLTLFVLFLVLGRMDARFRPDNWKRVRRTWWAAFWVCFLLFCTLALPIFILKQGGLEGIPRAARFQVWAETLGMAKDFPLFGVGLNSFSVISPTYIPIPVLFTHAENDYLQLLAETGLVGFALVLLFFVLFFRETRRLFRQRAEAFLDARDKKEEEPEGSSRTGGRPLRYSAQPRRKPSYPLPRTNYYLLWGCAASIVSLALHSLADFNLHIPANGLLFFLLLGLTYRLLHLRKPVFLFSPRRARNS